MHRATHDLVRHRILAPHCDVQLLEFVLADSGHECRALNKGRSRARDPREPTPGRYDTLYYRPRLSCAYGSNASISRTRAQQDAACGMEFRCLSTAPMDASRARGFAERLRHIRENCSISTRYLTHAHLLKLHLLPHLERHGSGLLFCTLLQPRTPTVIACS
jgi:hypothetical protein